MKVRINEMEQHKGYFYSGLELWRNTVHGYIAFFISKVIASIYAIKSYLQIPKVLWGRM